MYQNEMLLKSETVGLSHLPMEQIFD